jgi:glycosyltransferase involved in cell wall biosynthesis
LNEGSRLLDVALVVIGRNEGDRLKRCLESAIPQVNDVVYVDSGSTDGSIALAAQFGARVLALDLTLPFTAARARNAGAALAVEGKQHVRYIQFVDGDCELVSGWLAEAREFLESHPEVFAVCGRRRERFPERSMYNRLCDLEWDTPVGQARAFGGDVMIRAAAFNDVGGYRSDLIAGEDPELAIRLRQAGGQVWRVDTDMTLHDAAMIRFSQWWRRSVRAGYAYALGASIHGAPPERHWVRESRRSWIWGFFIPALGVLSALAGCFKFSIAVSIIFVLQWLRLFINGRGNRRLRISSATFLIIGKFAEFTGQVRFLSHRIMRRKSQLIEYK